MPVLLAEARRLHAAERQLVVAVVDLVDPGHPGVDLLRGPVDQPRVVRPDRRAEPVGRVVGARDGVVEVGEAEHRQHRAEHLLAHQPRARRPARRSTAGSRKHPFSEDPVPPPISSSPPEATPLSICSSSSSRAAARVDRAHPQLRLLGLDRPVAGLVAPDPLDQLGDERVVDRVVDEHALAAQAGLAGVPVAADDHRLDGGVDVGVGADDHRIRAAELERQPLEVGRGEPGDVAADRGRAGERDPAHVRDGRRARRRSPTRGP